MALSTSNLIALRARTVQRKTSRRAFGKTAIHTALRGSTRGRCPLGDFTSVQTPVTEAWKRPFPPKSSARYRTFSICFRVWWPTSRGAFRFSDASRTSDAAATRSAPMIIRVVSTLSLILLLILVLYLPSAHPPERFITR